MYYKLGQLCFITNQSKRCRKLGQLRYYQLGQLLQIRATVIIKQGTCYNLEQNLLQLGAGITNECNYFSMRVIGADQTQLRPYRDFHCSEFRHVIEAKMLIKKIVYFKVFNFKLIEVLKVNFVIESWFRGGWFYIQILNHLICTGNTTII